MASCRMTCTVLHMELVHCAGRLHENHRMGVQEDGTLDNILEDTRSLEMILEALCGIAQAKQQSEDVRVALAESIELLVSP